MSEQRSSSTSEEPRYDVAISFLSANEALALEIKDGLSDRLTTFVYSREQPDVVGRNTDGVEAFTNVFRHESRTCVVLHSDGWGKAGYTHIEEAAMKERALEHGWDFLIVVCLDAAKPPKWIPLTKVWYGFAKYGLDGLLATIDNRVTELGGRPKQDTVLERAARLEREHAFSERRQLFARSTAGLEAVRAEVARFGDILHSRVQTLSEAVPSLGLTFSMHDGMGSYPSVAASSPRASFVTYWQQQYSNTLSEAALLINEWGGRFHYSGFHGTRKLNSFHAIPTIDYANHVVWQLEEDGKALRSEALFDLLLDRLLTNQNQKSA